MKLIFKILLPIPMALLVGFSLPSKTSDKELEDLLIGYWYGESTQPGHEGIVQTISQYSTNHAFLIQFHVNNKNREQGEYIIEVGRWAVINGVKILQIKRVNGEDLPKEEWYTERYKLVALNETQQVYRHLGTGICFNSKRVDADFKFPKIME